MKKQKGLRADGRYQRMIMIGRDDNGKPRRVTVYGETYDELEPRSPSLGKASKTGTRGAVRRRRSRRWLTHGWQSANRS